MQFGHPVVERQEVVIRVGIAVAPRLVDEEADTTGEAIIVGHDQSALAGRDMFALLQAEAPDGADRSNGRPPDVARYACAQSSTTGTRCRSASGHNLAHLAGIAE